MPSMRLAGRWVGETQGARAPAHLWEIEQAGDRLQIRTRWENGSVEVRYVGKLLADEAAFSFDARFRAELLDTLHFVVPAWDTSETRGGVGQAYDVVFSRPGLAELSASAAYARYRSSKDASEG